MQKWKHYLLGRHFVILTNQRSLKFLTKQHLMGEDQFKWTSKLIGLDFEIRFRSRLENKAANALSRQMMYSIVSVVHSDLWRIVSTELEEDLALQQIIKGLQQGLDDFSSYSLHKGRLFYQGRVVLPKTSSQIPTLLAEFHASASGGHSGFLHTYKKLAGVFD